MSLLSSPLRGAEDLDFGLLSGYDYAATSERGQGSARIPETVRAWDGRRVSLVGYVMPIDIDEKGVRSFALIKDQASCCFGQTPKINHWVYVTLAGAPMKEIRMEPVRVEGTLKVGEFYEHGYLVCVYRMTADHYAPRKSGDDGGGKMKEETK